MDWIPALSKTLRFIEDNLTDELSIDDIARQAFASSSHFQLVFHLVMGITIGDYIRNRRLSLAALDLLQPGSKVTKVAERYGYDSPSSFSKAFSRFHGVAPSKIQRQQMRFFHPLTINVTVQGGFDMPDRFANRFNLLNWNDIDKPDDQQPSDAEKYSRLVVWARKARGENPGVFDALTEWILDDSEWTEDKLDENEQILMQGVFARFKEQNARLRAYLHELDASGVVNESVYRALDEFDYELAGVPHAEELREAVTSVFSDFSAMQKRSVREVFAGNATGPTGTDSVELFGYINVLKNCDAAVQWALFMPDLVQQQQNGFQVQSFEYLKLPAMRFIGREGEDLADIEFRRACFSVLDELDDFKSGFDYDVLFMHHNGLGVDVGAWHGVWGRFMKADTPVPDGFEFFDFMTTDDGESGPPYCSQCAFATFTGDNTAMHSREGFDSDAMYDVTRNIILGQGVDIPYPAKYWTAEVFRAGCAEFSDAYLFSAMF